MYVRLTSSELQIVKPFCKCIQVYKKNISLNAQPFFAPVVKLPTHFWKFRLVIKFKAAYDYAILQFYLYNRRRTWFRCRTLQIFLAPTIKLLNDFWKSWLAFTLLLQGTNHLIFRIFHIKTIISQKFMANDKTQLPFTITGYDLFDFWPLLSIHSILIRQRPICFNSKIVLFFHNQLDKLYSVMWYFIEG